MTAWNTLHLCCLFASMAGVQAAEAPEQPAVDASLLEFLGSWDAGDEQWLGAALTAADGITDAAVDPEVTETEDDDE